jgi:hypothetical protein
VSLDTFPHRPHQIRRQRAARGLDVQHLPSRLHLDAAAPQLLEHLLGDQLGNRLLQVNSTLQRLEQAMKGPEKALEAIVREVGEQGVRLALSALPRAFHFPVELAIRAVERVLDLGLGLGR